MEQITVQAMSSQALGVWIMVSQKNCGKNFYFGER